MDTDQICQMTFLNESIEQDYSNCEFLSCKFESVDFQKAKLYHTSWVNCHFHNCDFSNIDMTQSGFFHCEFKDCKLEGTIWIEVVLKEVTLEHCLARYLNLVDSKCIKVALKQIECPYIRIHTCYLKDCQFDDVNLESGEIMDTPFRKIDMRTCYLEGLSVTPDSLVGMIVTNQQAILLSQLLGIEIKEDL